MRIFLMGLAAAAALGASSASAASYLATYTGVVSGGSYAFTTNANGEFLRDTHDFGAVNGAFDGATFRATFRYDTGVGSETRYPYTDNLEGLAPNSPISRAAITINGQTGLLGPMSHSLLGAFNLTSVGFSEDRGFSHQAESDYNAIHLTLFNITVDPEFNQTFSGPTSGGDAQYSGGYFGLAYYDAATDTYSNSGGDLHATYLTVTKVPEPGTWALVLIGFASLGATLRLRRRSGSFAA